MALQERLADEVNKLLQTDSFRGAVLSQTVVKSDELQQMAEQYGITLGKAQLFRRFSAKTLYTHLMNLLHCPSMTEYSAGEGRGRNPC